MFLRMELVEEFAGLFPPARVNSLDDNGDDSSEDLEEEQFSEHEISDLDDL